MKTYSKVLILCALVAVVTGKSSKSPIVLKISAAKTDQDLLMVMLNALKGVQKNVSPVLRNCAELYKAGHKLSGVYTIDPDGKGRFKVYCDQKTDGGGWTVFQKRQDGSVDFYRGWKDYKKGFGDPKTEYWLGLDKINRLTRQASNRLRVDLMSTKGKKAYAEYNFFAVASENKKYKLSLGKYRGNAGDSFSGHSGMPFTTKDRDNDPYSKNCAVVYKGAWWYHNGCHNSNLNALYHNGPHSTHADGVNWVTWKGFNYSAQTAQMKIRPR